MNTMTDTAPPIVLAPGHWLGAWAWAAVAEQLRALGHPVAALTLPGLEPDNPRRGSTTLAQQADALGAAVTAAGAGATVLVAHSGAGYPTSLLLDHDPTSVARVVYVDSGPSADGATFDSSLPVQVEVVPLPPFDVLSTTASLEGLSEQDLQRFRERAVPQPGSLMREPILLHNEARRDVRTTIIACSFPSQVVMQMAHQGNPMMAEVATMRDLQLVDVPTGHWPMWSRPDDLAAAIAAAARTQ